MKLLDQVMRLTAALVKTVHREVLDAGPPVGARLFSEADYDTYLSDFILKRPDGPLYVFSYGSLIWKPAFEPVTTARAVARRWQRSFCLKAVRFRGTLEQPGLMMQIDRGGRCEGLVQEVATASEWADLSKLWRREMTFKPPSNLPRWIDVEVGGGITTKAIAFTANPESPFYVGELSKEEIAQTLSVACGHWGSGAEYLRETVLALEAAGIHDSYLWDLQDRVAILIETQSG